MNYYFGKCLYGSKARQHNAQSVASRMLSNISLFLDISLLSRLKNLSPTCKGKYSIKQALWHGTKSAKNKIFYYHMFITAPTSDKETQITPHQTMIQVLYGTPPI